MSGGDSISRRRGLTWRGLVLPVAFFALAEVAARVSHLDSDTLAAPSAIFAAGGRALADGSILSATGATLASTLAGLAIGYGAGVALGTLFALVPLLDRLLEVTVEAVRPVPPVALIPVALLVFGFGYRLEYSIVAFSTLWPALIFARAAIAGIDPRLLEVAKVLRLGIVARTWKIVLPATLPRLFVALRLSAGVALIVAVTVEISANTIGLGYLMLGAAQSLHPALALAVLLWVGVVGWLFNYLLLWAQRRLFGPAAAGVA